MSDEKTPDFAQALRHFTEAEPIYKAIVAAKAIVRGAIEAQQFMATHEGRMRELRQAEQKARAIMEKAEVEHARKLEEMSGEAEKDVTVRLRRAEEAAVAAEQKRRGIEDNTRVVDGRYIEAVARLDKERAGFRAKLEAMRETHEHVLATYAAEELAAQRERDQAREQVAGAKAELVAAKEALRRFLDSRT